jgi:ribonucleoside-diphosphate reductase alpha chain
MITKQAEQLLANRYAHKGEAPEGIYKRVAKALAIRDEKFEEILYNYMVEGIFLPNSPAIRNAGKKKGMLSACFVLPIDDSIFSIFETVKHMAVIFQRGGGVGINFSPLRPKGANLSGGGTSSGATSFMGIFDRITETVRQGGFRRGAAMGVLNFNHPEVTDFCRAKLKGDLTNFNLSVLCTDDFMEKATKGGKIKLVHDGNEYQTIRAKDILDLIALGTWVGGDPGVLFFDRINKDNPLYPKVIIDCCNPCSEIAMPSYGACTLGSINISKFITGDKFDFESFYTVCSNAARALLNCNIINTYPIQQITKSMAEWNPIGVGIMGFADALIMLGIYYDSKECLNFIEELCKPYVEATNNTAPDSFYKRSIALLVVFLYWLIVLGELSLYLLKILNVI